ncbi:MAG: YdcF family protein [Ignavibacteria bacterium]|jgi:vancomycin permeability regulator SanA|nr:YdcF family protein [Ignavibacteria bacterium]
MLKSKKKNTSNTNRNHFAIISFLSFLSLGLLIFIKYKNQNLPISEINFLYLGNVLNFLSYLALLIGVSILYLRKTKVFVESKKTIMFFLWLSLGMLILAWIFAQREIPLPDVYFLKQSLKKVLLTLFYLLSFFSLISITVYIWLELVEHKSALIIRTLINSVIIIIILFGFSFIYIQKNYSDEAVRKESYGTIAVVLGAAVWSNNKPSTSLKARVEKAVNLYQIKAVDKIQLTGGNAPGEMSEAEVAFNLVKESNVNLNDVFLENKTSSTAEQIRFIKNELITKKNFNNIVVISNNYHLSRIYQMSLFYNAEIKLIPADMKLNWDDSLYYKVREAIALLIFWFFAI